MRKPHAILGSAIFFVIAPLLFAGFVPAWISRWRMQPAFLGLEWTRAAGAMLLLAGIAGLADSFARFALQGLGTPAPIAPPTRLVVTGLYRFVRNPMYVAVLATIFGQALLLADWRLIPYGAAFWLATHLFVLFYEEPRLARDFGAEYAAYSAGVQRWIPRITPWRRRQ
jgi:protein-S-isoprenylcysteine O-methyltransferase Ste14